MRGTVIVVALLVVGAVVARGQTPLFTEMPTVRLAGVDHPLPPTRPTDAVVLQAAGIERTPEVFVRRIEVIEHRVGEVGYYPLVGQARLSSARFRCEVQSSAGVRVVVVPQDLLVIAH